MTLDECIEAISAVLDNEFSYEGNTIKARFSNHDEAVQKVFNARQALIVMRSVAAR